MNPPHLRGDVVTNLVGFAIIGATGLGTTIIIARFLGSEALGIFDQTYAIYIICSQFAAMGVHLSVLKHAAQYHENRETLAKLLASAITAVLFTGIPVSLITWGAASHIGEWFASEAVGRAIALVAPGLVFFGSNKVLMYYLAGLRRMRAYAATNIFRALVFLTVTIIYCWIKADAFYLATGLMIADILLFGILIAYFTIKRELRLGQASSEWLRSHFNFGLRGAPGSLATDANTRVDVLAVGWFSTDAQVGIYSFVAVIVTGLQELLNVFTNIANPIITQKFYRDGATRLSEVIRSIKVRFYLAFLPVLIGSAFLFLPLIDVLGLSPSYKEGKSAFLVYLFFTALVSGHVPFRNVLLQTGHPGKHTTLLVATLVCNCLLLAPLGYFFGIVGVAAAAGSAMLFYFVGLKIVAKRIIGVSV